MLSFLGGIYKNQYNIMQLIHMYKQLHTIKNTTLAGGGYTIMFYTIVLTYEYMNDCSYMIHMNICSCVHMLYI